MFAYVLKIEQGLDGVNKQIAKAGNVLLLMFGYLSLALNMQKVSRGRQSAGKSPFDIHLDHKGKIHSLHIKRVSKIK